MTPETFAWCHPSEAGHSDVRISATAVLQLQDVLNTFALGEEVIEGLDLKRLDPPDQEVWEFRSYIARPFLRVFGTFALPRNFVALAHRVRDDLELRSGPRWNRAIADTMNNRSLVFGGYQHFGGRPYREYVK
jgi:hypothetical protein